MRWSRSSRPVEEHAALPPSPDKVADFLIADFTARQQRANNSDSITAARVNLFLVVVTAGSVAVGWAWSSGLPATDRPTLPSALIAAGILFPILLVGLINFLWHIYSSLSYVEQSNASNKIREYFVRGHLRQEVYRQSALWDGDLDISGFHMRKEGTFNRRFFVSQSMQLAVIDSALVAAMAISVATIAGWSQACTTATAIIVFCCALLVLALAKQEIAKAKAASWPQSKKEGETTA